MSMRDEIVKKRRERERKKRKKSLSCHLRRRLESLVKILRSSTTALVDNVFSS